MNIVNSGGCEKQAAKHVVRNDLQSYSIIHTEQGQKRQDMFFFSPFMNSFVIRYVVTGFLSPVGFDRTLMLPRSMSWFESVAFPCDLEPPLPSPS